MESTEDVVGNTWSVWWRVRTWKYVEIVKETHVGNLPYWMNYLVNSAYLLNKPLIAGIKFKMNEWNPPKMSLETLEVYEEVWVPGKMWKSLKKLMFLAS